MSQGNSDVSVPVSGGVDGQVSRQVSGDQGLSGLEACSVMEVLNRISGKWAIGILLQAAQRPVRFTELERNISGISRRMLTLTLRNLERDGLLTRTVHPTVPPKVEYIATGLAQELDPALRQLADWAERNRMTIAASREAYDRAQ